MKRAPSRWVAGRKRALSRWVAFWDRHEPGSSLALIRIFVGVVIAYDLLAAAHYDVVQALWETPARGGMGLVPVALPLGATATWAIATSASVTLALGLFSRASALVVLFAHAALAGMLPEADRGIDVLLRNALILLALAQCGATLSIDARWRTGSFVSARHVPAWPRHLFVVQLATMYFFAGIQKLAPPWSSTDGYSALYFVLRDPHYATFDARALLDRTYPLLQLSTFATLLWERCSIALPLVVFYRETAARTPLARLFDKANLFWLWMAVGVGFHLMLAATMNLGIFPWGCLALYPALLRPVDLRTLMLRFERT